MAGSSTGVDVLYWHDDIGKGFFALMTDCDALLLGRRTYVGHAAAFEPMPAGDPFGDAMNAPGKYVVSKTLDKPTWRNTTIIRDNVIESIRALKAKPGKNILTDGSSQLVHALLEHDLVDELHLLVYPVTLGKSKRVLPDGLHATFTLASAIPFPPESWPCITCVSADRWILAASSDTTGTSLAGGIPMERKTAHDFDQELLILFDAYVHGALDRRGFLDKAAKFAVGGVTAAMLLDQLSPKFARGAGGQAGRRADQGASTSSTTRRRATERCAAISRVRPRPPASCRRSS